MDSVNEPYYRTICALYDMYMHAVNFAKEKGELSSPMLQRELGIPYHISAMLIDSLKLSGVIGLEKTSGFRYKVSKKL